jgi:hypothetical protein
MEITTDVPLHPFLFVGCWNNPNTYDYKHVFERIEADPIKTLILGGDNIYPVKDARGNKRYNVNEVQRGFDIARRGKTHIFTAVGNHNVTNSSVYEKEKNLYGLVSPYYCVHFTDGYSLIFLNSLYAINDDDAYTDELEAMLVWLKDIISKEIKYYIVMHHPISGIRGKGPWTLPNKNKILSILQYNLPIAILCSHLHFFQTGEIEFHNTTNENSSPHFGSSVKKISQYIVGTGGAKFDDPPSSSSHTITEDGDKFKYTVTDTQKINGYTRVVAPGVVEFVPVPIASGGRRSRSRSRPRRSARSRSRSSKRPSS